MQMPAVLSVAPRKPRRHRRPERIVSLAAAPVRRERVPPRVIVAAINRCLADRPECTGMRVHGRRWRETEERDDCNWSETCLVVRVHGSAIPGAFAGLRWAIAAVRARYDVIALPPVRR